MLNSKKIAAAVAAGVLGSFALLGAGAIQAFAADDSGKCVDDGQGQVRCEEVVKRQFLQDTLGGVLVINDSTQTCPTSRSQANCVSDVTASREKS